MSTTTKTGIVAMLLLAISCTKENGKAYSSGAALSINKTPAFSIGQQYGGGIIFYIDSTGEHGLVAAPQNLGDSIRWSNQSNITTGATGIQIGTGKSNTKQIIRAQGKPGSYAALLCASDTTGGYTDWFLPSKAELNILHERRLFITGLTGGNYWSSSEKSAGTAWCQHFHGGIKFPLNKATPIHVRAVRAF